MLNPLLHRAAFLCALVFPGLLQAGDTFRVCWYNVENWGVTDRWVNNKKVPDLMKPEDEQAAVLAILKKYNPDIFATCEVLQDPADVEKNARHLRDRLKAAGMDFKEMRMVRGEDTRGSLVLFSKFPITKFEALNQDTFKVNKKTGRQPGASTEQVTMRVGRGLLHAEIQVNPSYSFNLFSAHLKSKRPADAFDDDATRQKGDTIIRRNEALILRGHIMKAYQGRPDANLLVVGDLNDTMNYSAITTIVGRRGAEVPMHILPQADYLGDRWTHYFIPNCEYQKIDYMIASEGMAREYVAAESGVYRERPDDPKELKWTSASDHRMLFATFRASEVREPYQPDAEGGE